MKTIRNLLIVATSLLMFVECKHTKSENDSMTGSENDETEDFFTADNSEEPLMVTVAFDVKTKTFFHETSDAGSILSAYLIPGNKGKISQVENGFGFAIYTDAKNKETSGWLNLCDLTIYFDENPNLQFNTIAEKDTCFSPDKKSFILYDLSFTYPSYYPDGKILDNMRQQFITDCFGQTYKSEKTESLLNHFFKKSSEEDVNDGIFADLPTDESSESNVSFIFVCNNAIMKLEGNLLQYVQFMYEYKGGAHGMYATNYHIVNLQNGKLVSYKDIFKESEIKNLTKIIVDTYLKQMNYQSISETLTQSEDDFAPSDNIRIEDSGLIFHYGLYAIASYVEGEQDIFIPYSRLFPLMKRDSPLYETALKNK
jgi:hypothetical protein